MTLDSNYKTIVVSHEEDILRIELNRPEVYNAFNEEMIAEIKSLFPKIASTDNLRAVIVTGRGKAFSAGGDLNWMRKMADFSREENIADAREMADMYEAIASCSVPTIARVNGAAFGGGAGLVAVCDFAVAAENINFGFTEVNLGLIPAVISNFVIRRIGPTRARQLFLTGERFDSARAQDIGLVDMVARDPDGAIAEILRHLRTSGIDALRATKELVANYGRPDFIDYSVEAIADVRAGPEGRGGVMSFLEKRKPVWYPKGHDGGGEQ